MAREKERKRLRKRERQRVVGLERNIGGREVEKNKKERGREINEGQ